MTGVNRARSARRDPAGSEMPFLFMIILFVSAKKKPALAMPPCSGATATAFSKKNTSLSYKPSPFYEKYS